MKLYTVVWDSENDNYSNFFKNLPKNSPHADDVRAEMYTYAANGIRHGIVVLLSRHLSARTLIGEKDDVTVYP